MIAEREDEGCDALIEAALDDMIEFGAGQERAALQLGLLRMPDHHAVLVGLGELEAVPFENGPRAVQRPPGRDGVRNTTLRQLPERGTGVIGDL